MGKIINLSSNLSQFNLQSQIYHPNPSEEMDELTYYFDEVSGDGRGIE